MPSWFRKAACRLFLAPGLAAGLAGCTMTLADFFLYHPSPEITRTPGELGLPFEDTWFTAEDGVRLHGWFVPAPAPAATTDTATLLWFHGNAGNIGDRLETLELLHRRFRLHILLFDYRGYGLSEGRPSEEGLYRDASAALAYLRRHPRVRPEGIVFFGQSLGSAVAVELATRETPRGLILEAPFTSVRAMGKAVFPFLPISLLVGDQFNSLERIPRVRAPLLILHGDRDEVVPFQQGEALYRAANEPKTFLRIPGAGHNDLVDSGAAAYLGAWSRFLDGLGDPAVPPGRP